MFNKKMSIAQSWIFLVNISLKVSGNNDVGLLITKVAVSVHNEDAVYCVWSRDWILIINWDHFKSSKEQEMSKQKTAHVRDQSIYVAGSSWIVCTAWSNRNGEQVRCEDHFFSRLLFTISNDLDLAINSLSPLRVPVWSPSLQHVHVTWPHSTSSLWPWR